MSDTKSTLSSLAELIVPLLSTVFAIYYLITIQDIPFLAQMYGGGISFLLMFLCAAITLRIVTRIVKTRGVAEKATLSGVTATIRQYKKTISLVVGIALFIGLLPYLGYPIISFLFVALATYILGVKKVSQALLIALGVTVVGYFLFVVFLQVRIPLGPLRYLGI
jgi:hypothetical protein